MESLTVRHGREQDLDEVLRLWVQMVEFHAARDSRLRLRTDAAGQDSVRSYFRNAVESPDSRLFVAELAGEEGLAGFLLAHVKTLPPVAIPPTCGHISDICVDERLRRRGLGRQLFLAAKAWFSQRGLSYIRLGVAAANPVSQAFWRDMGASEQMLVMTIQL